MEDFQGFKEALLRQYKERYLTLKRNVDEEIADTVMARRIDIERTVYGLRVAHKKKLEQGLLNNRRRAELQYAVFREELQISVLEEIERRMLIQIQALRLTDRYACIMKSLAEEASVLLRGPAVALVEKGDADYLSVGGHIREIREELESAWGGVVLVEKRGRRIDNTLHARWMLLKVEIVTEIQKHLSGDFAFKE